MKLNKKEKIIFWIGLLTGIIGGAIGNFWVGSYFSLQDDFTNGVRWLTFLIFTIIFLGLIFLVNSQFNKTLNIKSGHPKKR
jgi:hypothetical protein